MDALLEVANHAVTHNKVFCLNLSAPFLIQFFQVCTFKPRVKLFFSLSLSSPYSPVSFSCYCLLWSHVPSIPAPCVLSCNCRTR